MGRYQVRAKNTATLSENKIHDDAVAAKLGFTGGLVPGVDVYAYLCHLPAERWGADWLDRGTMAGRFASPVYDGDLVEVSSTDADDGALVLELRDSKGDLCATGRATLPDGPSSAGAAGAAGESSDPIPAGEPLVDGARPADRRPASAEVFAALDPMRSLVVGFHADRAREYLDDIGERLDVFRGEGLAHPGWLLRQANFILSSNVRLGPWIHVSSDARHSGRVVDGDRVETRARVVQTYERKGHKFVELDVQWVVAERQVMRARHTAIYEPRGVGALR